MMTALALAAGMAGESRAQTPPAQPTPPALQMPSPAMPPTTIAQTTPAAVSCANLMPGLSDAAAMLGHIEDVVNEALSKTPAAQLALQKKDAPKAVGKPVGTTGATSMLVGIERDKLDQIRAEIAQLKVILKK
jgi:hypothetical protein